MSAAPERGRVVGARYRLESVLGEGGMAVVWTAVHTETDRRVALKLVRADFVRDERVREMFVREARVAARIGRNEHIVDVLDAGVDAELAVPFIAMELLEGSGLDAQLRKGPIPSALTAELLDQLAEALEQAHGAGVFHRDLKPQNLFVTRDRKGKALLKVLDFGIAKLSESAQQSATHIGTPAYSAPEQLGESWRAIAAGRQKTIAPQVSAATDVWALGLIAFEMLTGAAPGAFWGAQTLAELPLKIILEPLPKAASRASGALLPPGFDDWLARCLDLDARQRWPGARAAVQALTPMLRGEAGVVAPGAAANVAPAPPAASIAPPVIAPAAGVPPRHAMPSGPPPGTAPPGAPPPPMISPPGAPLPPMTSPPGAPLPPTLAPTDPRLTAWSSHRRAELRVPGDARAVAFLGQFLPRVEACVREARVPLPGGVLTLAEVVTRDPLRKAVGEDRMVFGVIHSPRLAFRGAARSKRSSGGLVDGMGRGLKALDALVGGPRAGMLGDPAFEQHFEVWAPSAHEAQAAFPVPVRQVMMQAAFHGIVERFAGAMVVTAFDARRFEPTDLDRLLDLCGRVFAATP